MVEVKHSFPRSLWPEQLKQWSFAEWGRRQEEQIGSWGWKKARGDVKWKMEMWVLHTGKGYGLETTCKRSESEWHFMIRDQKTREERMWAEKSEAWLPGSPTLRGRWRRRGQQRGAEESSGEPEGYGVWKHVCRWEGWPTLSCWPGRVSTELCRTSQSEGGLWWPRQELSPWGGWDENLSEVPQNMRGKRAKTANRKSSKGIRILYYLPNGSESILILKD